jgi:hypothetical protein
MGRGGEKSGRGANRPGGRGKTGNFELLVLILIDLTISKNYITLSI